MPGHTGDDYLPPTSAQLNSWENLLNSLLNAQYIEAANIAQTLDYSLVEFTNNTDVPNRTYYLLKAVGINYWGTYVYYPNYCRALILQSPHPKKDYNTGKEGIHVFHETESLFFMLSGTSRCNSSSFSSCSGSSTTCSANPENYRISDLAHNISTIYQLTTNILLNKFSSSYFLQLHGFSKLTSDPFIILSNGTQITPTLDYIASLETSLEMEDPIFTDSIKVAHQDLTWTRLRGFLNVQGRLINSSPDVCNTNANATNGRFIHMEQEKTKLRNDITGWNKVSNAVINTFPCMPLPIDLLHFEVKQQSDEIISISWMTVAEINNNYFTIERSRDAIDWTMIETIAGAGNSSTLRSYSYADKPHNKGTFYYRLKQTDYDDLSTFSKIKTIYLMPKDPKVVIYNIPHTNQFIINGKDNEIKRLKVFSILGIDVTKHVEKSTTNCHQISINLSSLRSALYFIRTKTSVYKVYKK